MVITIRLMINIIVTFLLIAVFIYKVSYTDSEEGILDNASWVKFLELCSFSVINKGNVREISEARRSCENKFIGKTFIDWTGYVIRVEDMRSHIFDFYHATKIKVKMEPENREKAVDMIITVNRNKLRDYSDVIYDLDKGDAIMFNVTLRDVNHFHFHMVGIQRIEGYKELPDDIHDYSRYARGDEDQDNSRMFVKKNLELVSEEVLQKDTTQGK